jgi:hypothetical protein
LSAVAVEALETPTFDEQVAAATLESVKGFLHELMPNGQGVVFSGVTIVRYGSFQRSLDGVLNLGGGVRFVNRKEFEAIGPFGRDARRLFPVIEHPRELGSQSIGQRGLSLMFTFGDLFVVLLGPLQRLGSLVRRGGLAKYLGRHVTKLLGSLVVDGCSSMRSFAGLLYRDERGFEVGLSFGQLTQPVGLVLGQRLGLAA